MSQTVSSIDTPPQPVGDLVLQTVTMPKDTNANGDIFGGWLLSQMDIAGGIAASRVSNGRVATVAVEQMSFLVPVEVGAIVSCHAKLSSIGTTSMHIVVEVWKTTSQGKQKVTDGTFVYVAIDERGRTRPVEKRQKRT